MLRGRFFGWSGFIRIRGQLEQEFAWPEGVPQSGEAEVEELPPWAELGVELPIPGWDIPRDVMDFFLFLAMRDRRAVSLPPRPARIEHWEVGLVDDSGWALAGHLGVRVAGGAKLLGDLRAHLDAWLSSGRPRIEDWQLSLAPRGVHQTQAMDSLIVERANYRQEARFGG